MAIFLGGRMLAAGTDLSGLRRPGGRGPLSGFLQDKANEVVGATRGAVGDAVDAGMTEGRRQVEGALGVRGGGGGGGGGGGSAAAQTTPTIRREGVGNVFIERKDRGRYERGAPWGAYGTYWFMDWGDGRRFVTKELGEGGVLFYKEHLVLKRAGGCPTNGAFRGNVNCKSFLSPSRAGIGGKPTAWVLLDEANNVLTAPLISEGFPGNKFPAKTISLRIGGPYPPEGDPDGTQLTAWAAEVEAAEDTTARTAAASQNLARAVTAGREAAWRTALRRTTDPRHLAILLGKSTAADWEPSVVTASGGRSTQEQPRGGGGEGSVVPTASSWGKWVGIGAGVLALGVVAFALARRRRRAIA